MQETRRGNWWWWWGMKDAINWILNSSYYNWAFKLYQHSSSSLEYFAIFENTGNAI